MLNCGPPMSGGRVRGGGDVSSHGCMLISIQPWLLTCTQCGEFIMIGGECLIGWRSVL